MVLIIRETVMPWKKQFDVDQAREKAKDLFWAKGYEATSMDDLLECMGINRGSFYATFQGKRELYTDVLRRYDRENRSGALGRLRDQFSPRQRILALFEGVRQEARGKLGTRGCFLANATMELAASDRVVGKLVRTAYVEIEEFFHNSIVEGQAAGEIHGKIDSRKTARTLLGLLLGMRVLARSGAEDPILAAIAGQVEDLI